MGRTAKTTLLALATFLTIIPVTLVVPVLKSLVQDTWGVGVLATSLFMSANMVGALVAAPLAGALADKLGWRKGLIVAALLVDAALLAALPRTPVYAVTMAVRILEGAAHITALSLVLAMAAEHARASGAYGRVMGTVGAALMLGVALGAPAGGFLGRTSATLPLDAGAALAVVAAIVIGLTMRDDGARAERPKSLAVLLALLRQRRDLRVPFAFAFIDRFTVGFFVTTFPLYLANVHGQDPRAIGASLASFLLPFALLCYPAGRLIERRSAVTFLAGGSLVYGVGVMAVALVPLSLLPALMLLLGVVSSVMFVPTLVLTGRLSGPELKATAMGGFNAAGSLGFLTGPLVAGLVAQSAGELWGAHNGYVAAFVVAGASEIVCVALALPALRRLRSQPELAPG